MLNKFENFIIFGKYLKDITISAFLLNFFNNSFNYLKIGYFNKYCSG
jgi:hypothetical protein